MAKANTKSEKKFRLDFFNVAYGVGASIVIIGAMFKFLDMQYAYEFLAVGLTVEAAIFFISAFEPKKVDTEYKWEKIFPQLVREEKSAIEKFDEIA